MNGYVKAVKKNRHLKDKKFCYSTLHNYHNELEINKEIELNGKIIENEVAVTKFKGREGIVQVAKKKAEEHNKKKDKN